LADDVADNRPRPGSSVRATCGAHAAASSARAAR